GRFVSKADMESSRHATGLWVHGLDEGGGRSGGVSGPKWIPCAAAAVGDFQEPGRARLGRRAVHLRHMSLLLAEKHVLKRTPGACSATPEHTAIAPLNVPVSLASTSS